MITVSLHQRTQRTWSRSGRVNTEMSDVRGSTSTQPGHPSVGKCNEYQRGVKRHVAKYISAVSVASQCKLVSRNRDQRRFVDLRGLERALLVNSKLHVSTARPISYQVLLTEIVGYRTTVTYLWTRSRLLW